MHMCVLCIVFLGLRDESGLGRTPLSPTSVTSGYKSDASYDRKLFMTSRHFVAPFPLNLPVTGSPYVIGCVQSFRFKRSSASSRAS